MQIETILEHKLTDADEVAINHLLMAAFREGFEDRSFYQQRHVMRLLVRGDSNIIGHIALSYRSIRLGDQLVRVFGLGEVATHPDHQGQGIGSALLKASIDVARDSAADFYLLFGVRPLYEGHGFRSVPNPMTYVEMKGAMTGAVTTTEKTYLMVMDLKDLSWDDAVPVDLLGHMF